MTSAIARFSTPIPYGDGKLSELTMRPPKAGDLRGLKLIGLTDMDPALIMAIAARASLTPVAVEQLAQLELYDLMVLTEKVVGFFAKPETPAESPTISTGRGPT